MNKLVKWTCIAASLCFFMTVGAAAAEDPAEKEIKKLIIKRTDVMESVLFGKITYEEGCRLLEEVETGILYSEDIAKLRDFRKTDLAKTEKIQIISLEENTRMYDKASYTAEIKWTESYGMQVCINVYMYDIGAEIRNGKYRLTTFEIQQK